MQQLKSVQALRAIAALAVMFAHLQGLESQMTGGPPLLSSGWIAGVSGVDLFFVISGFIALQVAPKSSTSNSFGERPPKPVSAPTTPFLEPAE